MRPKKTPEADLEKKKVMFFQTGLATVLALLLIAFEWTTRETTTGSLGELTAVVMEEDIIPVTRPEEPETLPPTPPPLPTEILEIVEDNVEIDVDFVLEDVEAREDVRILFTQIPEIEQEEEVADFFYIVEDMPDFMGGGVEAFHQWVYRNLRYPPVAAENGIQGRVTVQFIVNVDGTVTDVTLLRSVDASLDREAIRVISQSPRWTPGMQRGTPVRVAYIFPINFRLE